MTEEVRIKITAKDEASPVLKGIGDEASRAEPKLRDIAGTGRMVGDSMEIMGVQGDRAVGKFTRALDALAAHPALLVFVAVLGAALGTIKLAIGGVTAALENLSSRAEVEFQRTFASLGGMWSSFQQQLGASLIPALQPSLNSLVLSVRGILTSLTTAMPGIVTFMSFVGKALAWAVEGVNRAIRTALQLVYIFRVGWVMTANIIGAVMTKVVQGVITAINKAIGAINKAIGGLPSWVLKLVGGKGFKIQPIGQIGNWTNFAMPSAPTFTDIVPVLEGAPAGGTPSISPVGGAGGGGGGGDVGGTGASIARALAPAGGVAASSAIGTSANQGQIMVQQLEEVTGSMAELLALMRALPESIRDAIVVYSG